MTSAQEGGSPHSRVAAFLHPHNDQMGPRGDMEAALDVVFERRFRCVGAALGLVKDGIVSGREVVRLPGRIHLPEWS